MPQISVDELTSGRVGGTGVYDRMMETVSRHVSTEYREGRIKETEYATVYLSALDSTMSGAIRFLLDRENAELVRAQVLLAQAQLLNTEAERTLIEARIREMEAQADIREQELLNLECEQAKCRKQIELMDAELLNVPKQGLAIDAGIADTLKSTEVREEQRLTVVAERLNVSKQGELIDANVADTAAGTAVKVQQEINLAAELPRIEADVLLTQRNADNELLRGAVLVAQECDLKAAFDLKVAQTGKTVEDQALVTQKIVTERGQTDGSAFNPDSILGRQGEIYRLQGAGFIRDAEQKAAEVAVRCWTVARTTDPVLTGYGDVAVNGTGPGDVREAIAKLQAGASQT